MSTEPRENEHDLSVNWSKYITPELAAFDPRGKNKLYLGQLKAIIPRNIDLYVTHTPSKRNKPHAKSHTSITGQKLLDEISAYEVAGILADNCETIVMK